MLEKLGLPSKPANRGAAWVVDASHCQGCSSQFTFINRKHHCRRCGGLFCGSCTQQRMVLRGQGDSPVRICDPCKKLEDAARFELRYGHKNKAAKGNTKQVSKHEEEVLSQILGTDRKQPLLSEHESHTDLSSIGFQKSTNCASSSSFNEKSDATSRDIGILKSLSVGTHGNTLHDIGSISPEELRLQAAEQKKKYRILKGEGKSDEALQAFKSSKELERQAGALELALRKSRRMASMTATVSNVTDVQKADDSEESNNKKLPSQRVKESKDDLASELRELGWSDADLRDGDKKPTKLMTLEGELSNLLGEMPKKSSAGKGIGGIDKTQVIAHKKKALTLKREGKLAEAKEELKRAKILEKQLEEQELLGEAEESDDELSALIRSMDGDKQDEDEFLLDHAPDTGFNFDHLLGDTNDFATEGNFEVTDDDMNNPELAAALKSFGWSDEEDEHEGASDHVLQPACLDLEALQSEILALKREALSQKRAGNVAEAMSLLKKAKLLEKDLESSQSDVQTYTPNIMEMSSTLHLPFEPSMARTTDEMNVIENVRMQPKSKVMIQRELLSLKKKALALRREGRAEEAEEELKKGKVLEQQLEQMENAPTIPATKYGKKVMEPTHVNERGHGTLDLTNEVEAEVTEQDLHDPALLSVLKNLGWNDDDTNESVNVSSKVSKNINPLSAHDSVPLVKTRKAVRSKTEVQKELLSVKRKALALRRQGKIQEAEEELKRAKDLENEMADIENASSVVMESQSFGLLIPLEISDSKEVADDARKADSSVTISRIPKDEELEHGSFAKLGNRSEGNAKDKFSILPHSLLSLDMIDSLSGSDTNILSSSVESVQNENQYTEVLPSVNVATQPAVQVTDKVNTSRNNYIFSHTASNSQMTDKPETAGTTTSQSETPERNSELDIDARKAEILAHKRKAVAFKREGNLAEAREVLRQAKLLEKSLEDAQQAVVGTENASTSTDGSSVMQEGKTRQAWKPPSGNSSVIQESRTSQVQKPVSGRDRFKLQQESLSHKRNALKLRREGKIAESEAEFELAKALESQLEELSSQGKAEATADPFVEDLLDPQLMSALKSVGWGDTDFAIQTSEKSEPKTISDRGTNPHSEKDELEEQIKAEKLRALNFKRAGKQAEALEALRAAKRLEKKLGLLT